jgi:hypothetical protein
MDIVLISIVILCVMALIYFRSLLFYKENKKELEAGIIIYKTLPATQEKKATRTKII